MSDIEAASTSEREGQIDRGGHGAWWLWPLAIAAGILIGYGGAYFTRTLAESNRVDFTEYARDFQLELFQGGESISLVDLKGKGVVLNFWASWCFPCRQEMPALEAAWQKYAEQGVMFVGVNIADERGDALEFLREYNVTYPNGIDVLGTIEADYQLLGYPTTWFIKADGSVARKVLGPLNLEELDEAIALILPE